MKILRLQLILALGLFLSLFAGATSVTIEKPALLDGAIASITISDVHGFLDAVGEVANGVSPMVNGALLKSMLGMGVGDPGLFGLTPGSGISVIALSPTNIFAVLEVSPEKQGMYTNTVMGYGFLSACNGDVIVLGKTPEQLSTGLAHVDQVKESVLNSSKPTLRFSVSPKAAELPAMLDGLMNPMLSSTNRGIFSGAAQSNSMIRILEIEFAVIGSLLSQMEILEFEVECGTDGVRVHQMLEAIEGSNLHDFLSAPRVAKPAEACFGQLPPAAIAVEFEMGNPDAWNRFVLREIEQVVEKLHLTNDLAGAYNTFMGDWLDVIGGGVAESLSFDPVSGLQMNMLIEVSDAERALELLGRYPGLFEESGMLDLYEDLGMPVEFSVKRDARTYQGTAIHELKLAFDLTGMETNAAEQLLVMNMMNQNIEIAFAGDLMLYAMGTNTIEHLIELASSSAGAKHRLNARDDFPEHGSLYFDYDIAAYMHGIISSIPGEENPVMESMLSMYAGLLGAEPLTGAGYSGDGRMKYSLLIPGSLINRIGKTVMSFSQQMKTQMQAGAEVEGDAEEPVDVGSDEAISTP